MKKILLALTALLLIIPARAQMTPEAVMGMTPDLPSIAALLNHWKEHNDPLRDQAPDSDILNEFMEAWNSAWNQVQDMQAKTLAPSVERDVMEGKVGGTGKTARQVSEMSEAEVKALAMSTMNSRLGGLGLSQADIAKLQSGNLSKESQEAMAGKVLAARTGGLTTKDIEAMSHMTDEQRRDYMQESGLGESITAKMAADKNKNATSAKQYQLATEMTRLGQEVSRLQNKATGKIEIAKKDGLALFDRKYRKTDDDLKERIHQANIAAEEAAEKGADAVRAAEAHLNEVLSLWFANMSRFYAEYIPMYRDAVSGAMECCRAELLPVLKKKQDVEEKLYALTGSAEYGMSATTPFLASSLYFELSKEIVDFELDLN